jgi:hypothetical protein
MRKTGHARRWEFEEIFVNRSIESDRDNNQVVNIPGGSNLMKENFHYDDIDNSYKPVIEGSLLNQVCGEDCDVEASGWSP